MGEQQSCSRCPALEAEIARLRYENRQLKTYISYLLNLIGTALHFTSQVRQEADQVLSQHQPPGTWTWVTSAKEVAIKVQDILEG